jgi:D,D-heptose 1,7-bisphosphate phosphatase
MKVVIMAGGKGSRIKSIAAGIPKPMVPVCGKPILEHQIECLKKNNLTDIIISVGYLGRKIKDYFGDGGNFGCSISYFTENEPLGTAGALYKMPGLSGDFFLINGDLIFDVDFSRMISFHKDKKALATLAVHPNSHPFDSSVILTNYDCQITGWLNREDERVYYKNQVNSGIHILSADLIKICPQKNEIADLDRDVLKPSISVGKLFAYSTPEYIKDMGTPERYAQVSQDIENGIVRKKNLAVKQNAVFLDRDGTINKFNNFITKPENFILIESATKAIKTINRAGYLAIVITNQPVIARGEIDLETLDHIHMKMETDLGRYGAYIDDLFYCPHHPDRGFPGEIVEYKIDCGCRKPKPGMIYKAAEKYNIDLSNSYMVGDDMRDVQAGINAGCIPVYLTKKHILENNGNYKIFNNLLEFTERILKQEVVA